MERETSLFCGRHRVGENRNIPDLIRRMMDLSGHQATGWGLGEKIVAFDEKEFERPGNGFAFWSVGLPVETCGSFPLCLDSLTGVLHVARGSGGSHVRVEVREMENVACKCHRHWLVAVEGVKKHLGTSVCIMNIGSKIEFLEPGQPRKRREPPGPDPFHKKRHDTQVRVAVKRVHGEALRKRGLDEIRANVPV